MASMQCQRNSDHTNHKPTNNNEHRFSNKVKEMANSVTKVFTEHRSHGHNNNEEKKKEGHCLPRMGDHKKREKNMKKKKNKESKSSDDSSSDSEDEGCRMKD